MRRIYMLVICCLIVAACQPRNNVPDFELVTVIDNLVIDERSVPIFPRKAALTTDTARRFALDLPKRCTVDWDNQRVKSNLPEEVIEMINLGTGDELPGFAVENFSFQNQTVKEVLEKLLSGTKIVVIEEEPIIDKISGDIKSGELSDAVALIARMGRAYYSYDDDARELRIMRRTRWLVKMPRDESVIMALIDAMRGAEIRNLLVNWQDKTMEFAGNFQTERDVRRIIADLGAQKYIIAWDIDVYRVYPRSDNPIIWMNMLPALGQQNIRMSIPGVVGRALVVGPEINTKTLQAFLAQQSNVVLISQGTFSIPNGWQSRFDIGQCSREERLETNLIIGATAKFGDYAGMKKLDATVALRTNQGEIASYTIPSTIGDNYVIIGIPTHAFVQTPETLISPFAELVVFMSPRITQIVRNQTPARGHALSGQSLRDYLEE